MLNFSECAGLLDIRWVDDSGNPAEVTGGSIQAFRETAPGSGTFLSERTSGRAQAWDIFIPPGRTQEYLAVRGDGARYQVNVTFERGTDPFSDKVRSFSQHIVVNCDEIVRLNCVVPSGGFTGEIVGRVDMLGENEHRFGGFTGMVADQGPFDNFRLDNVLASTSQGLFRMEKLAPYDAVTPSRGYRVYCEMSFRLRRRYEYFAMPF
ncbi:MAG: hypothetical protein EXS36_17660 [Pedosphaera sp.]|nr:hypothetical protein [Pedosphaera sp.]